MNKGEDTANRRGPSKRKSGNRRREDVAQLADKLSHAGLDAEYWAGILETKLGITLPQQLQFLDESYLGVLVDSTRYAWEKKALRNFLGINNEPPSNQEVKDAKSEIVVKLTEAGLDGDYWAKVLKENLGITRMVQTTYIHKQSLKKLKDAVRYDWEEKTLKHFFGLSCDDYEASLAKRQEQHKQRIEEGKNLLSEVVELKQKGMHHTDDMINSKLDQLRQVINVPKERWVDKNDDKSLDDIINNLNSDLQDLDKLADDRPVKSSSEILANASAGLALRGVLVGKAFSDNYLRRIVLSTPTNVTLMNPVMEQIDDVVHFSSKTQSDHFHHSLGTMGYSVAATVKGGGWGFHAEAGFSESYQEENEKESETHQHTQFESRVIYTVVPTAACELNSYDLKLSHQALQELKIIDKLLTGNESQTVVNKQCEKFLKYFGSHINVGVLHFGGVNKFVATYTSDTQSNSDETKSMVRDALSAYVSASYSGLGISVGGSVSADHMDSHGNFTGDYAKSEQAKVRLYTTRNGGPQEVSKLSLWKMGIVTYNSAWALIDRGKTLSRDFIGIWKLISNHGTEFLEPHKLASSLMTVWKRMSGYLGAGDREQILIKELDPKNALSENIYTGSANPVLIKRCIEYLQEVLKTVVEVEPQTGTKDYREDKLCTQVEISSFLEKAGELKDKFADKDVSMMKFLILKLVTPIGFSGCKEKIMKWAEVNIKTVDVPSILGSAKVHSIPDLIWNTKEIFLPALKKEHGNNLDEDVQVHESIDAAATVDLALCVGQLLKDLESSYKFHEVLFLKVTLLPFHYHWRSLKFEKPLPIEKLQKFIQSVEELWKRFHFYKEKGTEQLEAFLINISIGCGHFVEGSETSENEFLEITKDVRQITTMRLQMELVRYANSSPFDLTSLKEATNEIAQGHVGPCWIQ